MGVQVRLLGPLEVLDASGRPAAGLTAPRQRALVALLASRAPAVVHVDTIVDQLWPDGPPDGALSTLQAYVSYVRRALEPARAPGEAPRVLVTRPPGYALLADDVDVIRLQEHASQAERAAASGDWSVAHEQASAGLALLRGEPYEDLGDLPFAVAERSRLEDVVDALEECAGEAESWLGRHAAAVSRLGSLLERRPLRESAAAALVVAQYRAGNQADALSTYDRVRRDLADELGVDPGPRLAEVHRLVLAQDVSLVAPPRPAGSAGEAAAGAARSSQKPSPVPVALDEEPFVGRAGVWASLTGFMAAAAAGTPQCVVVVGSAGIGKSRLARRLREWAAGHGWTSLGSLAWDDEGAPAYALWAPLLDDLGTGGSAALDALRTGEGDALDPGARSRLGRDLAAVLEAASADRPVLLVLEDVHWAGHDGVALLRDALPSLGTSRVLVVVTARPEAAPSSSAVADLVRSGARRVELGELSDEEVARLCDLVSDVPLDPAVRDRVVSRAGGNPLFAVELVRAVRSRSADVQSLPDSVRDLVLGRASRLPQEGVELLGAAATLGRRFDVRLLADVIGRPVVDVLDLLEPAVVVGLLVDDAGMLAFSHALVRDAFYGSLPVARRMRAHLRAADTLEAAFGPGGGARANEVVWHLDAAGSAGDPLRLARALLVASRGAAGRLGYDDAEQMLGRARELVSTAPESPERHAVDLDVTVARGSLSARLHGYAAPQTAAERARAVALVADVGGSERLLGTYVGLSSYAVVSGRIEDSLGFARTLTDLGRTADDPLLLGAGLLQAGWTHWHAGRPALAQDDLAAAIDSVDRFRGPMPYDAVIQHPGAMARSVRACALTDLGDAVAGRALAEEAIAVAEADGHRFSIAMTRLFAAWRLSLCREVEEMTERAGAVLELAMTEGFPNVAGPALAMVGGGRVLLGDPGGAALVHQARDAMRGSGATFLSGWFAWYLGEAALLAGELDVARAEVQEGLDACESTGERFPEPELLRIAGLVERAAGDEPRARALLSRAVGAAERSGARLYADRARADLAAG